MSSSAEQAPDDLNSGWSSARELLCQQYPQQRWLKRRLIFSLPVDLIGQLPQLDAPRWSDDEIAAERALAQLADEAKAIGFDRGHPIQQPLLARTPPSCSISLEAFNELGWDKAFTYDAMTSQVDDLTSALDDVYVQSRAYLGYLLTCREFRQELRDLKRHRLQYLKEHGVSTEVPAGYYRQREPDDPVHDTFLSRWSLSNLHHWHAPLPQGPIPAGFPTPVADSGFQTILVPHTFRVPARSPLARSLTLSWDSSSNPGLQSWHEIVHQKGEGSADFERIPYLYYWLDLALLRRYRWRIEGSFEFLDDLFSTVLAVSSSSVRKARHLKQKRQKRSG